MRTPEDGIAVAFDERPIRERPFSPEGAGVVARAQARRIPSWKLERGWATEIDRADQKWADAGRPLTTEP